MTLCLCGLLAATLSAANADLDTTRQFTASGAGHELNPIARPFVSGRGARGEVWLGGLTAAAYLQVDRLDEPWRTLGLGAGFAAHTLLATRHHRLGLAPDVPRILFPILVITW